jgi:hypothetical protein
VNQYQVSGLAAQSYLLWVSAESQNGLDGYPSALGMLQVDRAEPHCAQADIVGAARPAPGRTGAPARCDAGAFEWPLFHMLIDGFDDVSAE